INGEKWGHIPITEKRNKSDNWKKGCVPIFHVPIFQLLILSSASGVGKQSDNILKFSSCGRVQCGITAVILCVNSTAPLAEQYFYEICVSIVRSNNKGCPAVFVKSIYVGLLTQKQFDYFAVVLFNGHGKGRPVEIVSTIKRSPFFYQYLCNVGIALVDSHQKGSNAVNVSGLNIDVFADQCFHHVIITLPDCQKKCCSAVLIGSIDVRPLIDQKPGQFSLAP